MEQTTRPRCPLSDSFNEAQFENQVVTETITISQQQMLLQTVNEAIALCSTKTLTQADVDKINEALSHRSSLYSTDYRQVGNAFKGFVSGHGYIKTGGFDFEFQRTNSFRLSGLSWPCEMSDAALFMLLAFIFGLIVFTSIYYGASIFVVQAGAATYSASCSIQ